MPRPSPALVRRLSDDTIHTALLYNLPPDTRLQFHAARHDPMRIVVQPDHPLTRLGRRVLSQILRLDALGLLPGPYGVRQALCSAEHQFRLRLAPRPTNNSPCALRHFAKQWGGVLVKTSFCRDRGGGAGKACRAANRPAFPGGFGCPCCHTRGQTPKPHAQLRRAAG